MDPKAIYANVFYCRRVPRELRSLRTANEACLRIRYRRRRGKGGTNLLRQVGGARTNTRSGGIVEKEFLIRLEIEINSRHKFEYSSMATMTIVFPSPSPSLFFVGGCSRSTARRRDRFPFNRTERSVRNSGRVIAYRNATFSYYYESRRVFLASCVGFPSSIFFPPGRGVHPAENSLTLK